MRHFKKTLLSYIANYDVDKGRSTIKKTKWVRDIRLVCTCFFSVSNLFCPIKVNELKCLIFQFLVTIFTIIYAEFIT